MNTSESARATRVTASAIRTLASSGLRHNPYFKTLADGSMTLAGFRRSQEQFFFAVTFFSTPDGGTGWANPQPEGTP